MSDSVPAQRRSVLAIWLPRVAVLVVAVPALWVVSNHFPWKREPAPLFSKSDLPTAPAPAENGWETFKLAHATAAEAIPDPLARLLATKVKQTPAARWAAVQAKKAQIAAFVAAHKSRLPPLEAALGKPAFADACPLRMGARCDMMSRSDAHEAVELAAFDRALDGQWGDAFQLAAKLAHADGLLVASFRLPVVEVIGLLDATRTTTLIDTLLAGFHASQHSAVDPAVVYDLTAALQSIDPQKIDLRRAVIGEYLLDQGALDHVVAESGFFGKLTLDRAETQRLLDDRFRALARFAQNPSGPRPPVPPLLTNNSFYWLHNASGKRFLDLVMADLGSLTAKAAHYRTRLVQARTRLLHAVPATLAAPT